MIQCDTVCTVAYDPVGFAIPTVNQPFEPIISFVVENIVVGGNYYGFGKCQKRRNYLFVRSDVLGLVRISRPCRRSLVIFLGKNGASSFEIQRMTRSGFMVCKHQAAQSMG